MVVKPLKKELPEAALVFHDDELFEILKTTLILGARSSQTKDFLN